LQDGRSIKHLNNSLAETVLQPPPEADKIIEEGRVTINGVLEN
jgi:16S rRNA U516 pseudouridylate synthase RsuA-like enzyme